MSTPEQAAARTRAMARAVAAGSGEQMLQRWANRIAAEGQTLLNSRTGVLGGAGKGRWGLSGMASASMGGPHHTFDKSWEIASVSPRQVVWRNANPIYSFLDKGTRPHGPLQATQVSPTTDRRFIRAQSKRGAWQTRQPVKMLFIPLNEKTARAYYNGELHQWFGSLAQTHTIGKGKRKGQSSRRMLKWGVDFVMARHVRGIAAKNMTPKLVEELHVVAGDVTKELVRQIGLAQSSRT